jgi:hypothetical protein
MACCPTTTSAGRKREQLHPVVFVEKATSGAQLQWTMAERGQGEVERDECALLKLWGGMTDTALAILIAGITTSHLRMHHHELRQ